MGTAWSLTGTLVSGLLVWGGIGYLIDRAAGFHWLFLPIGMVIGIATGIYVVYLRYGRDDTQT
jgi:F0F1-type ATP synthase assembly protein I